MALGRDPESAALAQLLLPLAGELGRFLWDGHVLPRRLTRQQLRVLMYLRGVSEGLLLTELTRLCGVTQGTMTVALQRMETMGVVRRQRDPEDARALRVTLSPAGAELASVTAHRMVKAAQALCAELAPRERARLQDCAGYLLAALEARHGRPRVP